MMNARRDDTGIYTLKIENEHGSDSADVSVIVTVAPSKPHGPLKIHDVYAEGCTCDWAPPQDDGDAPIMHYLIEKLEGKQTQWVACGRTNGDTTTCHIVGLNPGEKGPNQVEKFFKSLYYVRSIHENVKHENYHKNNTTKSTS